MSTIFFHSTTPEAARRILEEGFRDHTRTYLADQEFTGVWLANRPLDVNEGCKGDTVLRVQLDVEPSALDQYEWINEMPELSDAEAALMYREWLVPADLINTLGSVSLEEDSDGPLQAR